MEWDSAVLNNDLSMHVLFIHSFFFFALYSLLMKIQECQPKCFPEHTKNILIFKWGGCSELAQKAKCQVIRSQGYI